MKKRLSVLLAATAIFTGSIAYAETENINAALRELSELYDSPVVRVDQARAICNQEQYIIECAEIGKKYDLFPEEQEREVDALLTQFKGSVIEEFKQCVSTECLINVAARIAQELSTANPTLARTIDLTPEKVTEKRTIVDVAKTIGVDIDECRAMDPDTASVELLRACAKLAKHETVQRYIPEEYRVHVEKTENTAALKEALENGDIACGDGTLQGCGTFCLNPGTRTQGGGAIPPVCRQIAERFFGNEGIRELDSAYEHVRRTYDEAQIIYTEEYRNRLREGTTTPNTILCPAVINYSPCPPGQYRQESINEFGCFVRSACVPFNTRTLPKFEDNDRQVICPAMPTVSSCGINEERVAAYSSPECGTYYTCRPKVEDRSTKFPYTFRGGRVVVSFEEARIYCYESGFNGATARGDKGECLQTFHITVPEIPPEKQCAQYGTGWHSMDQSGNCFSESMTEYRTPGGILQQCSTAFIYGCTSNKDIIPVPFGQREQVWNSLGLRSWIRSDASESRISELKAACANVSSNSNIWLSGAGTQSSVDFGMPDTEKCRKATTCSSAQYWDGNGCVALTTTSTTTWSWTGYGTTTPGEYKGDATSCPGFAYSRWDKTGARYCQLNTQTSCQYFYPQYLTLGNYAPSSCPAEQSTGTVSGSCSTELINLLGSGCHSMSSAWFNSGMTSYVMPGGTTVRSCATEPISGCSGSNITTGTAQCADGRDNDNDGATDYPADSSCYDKTDNDEWYPSSGSTSSSTSIYNSGCPSGQYWSGTSCVTSSGGGYEGPAGSAVCSDGIDNDGDNLIDNADSSCQHSSTTTTGGYEGPYGSSLCSDGIDNDADGLIDSADTSCQSSSSATCSSGQYWNGSSCVTSTGTGNTNYGSCGSYTSQSSCISASNCYWYSNSSPGYCYYQSSSPTTSSCPSGQYWNGSACVNTSTTDCASGQYWNGSTCVSSQTSSSCSSGQYWDGNACVSSSYPTPSYPTPSYPTPDSSYPTPSYPTPSYPTPSSSSSLVKPLAFLCPSGHLWNGSYCTYSGQTGVMQSVANIFEAFLSPFRR